LLPGGDWRNPKITGWGVLAGNPLNKVRGDFDKCLS